MFRPMRVASAGPSAARNASRPRIIPMITPGTPRGPPAGRSSRSQPHDTSTAKKARIGASARNPMPTSRMPMAAKGEMGM